MSPEKLLRTAYAVRNFRTVDMERLFIKTEMYLKSRTPHYDAGGGCGGGGGGGGGGGLGPRSFHSFHSFRSKSARGRFIPVVCQ